MLQMEPDSTLVCSSTRLMLSSLQVLRAPPLLERRSVLCSASALLSCAAAPAASDCECSHVLSCTRCCCRRRRRRRCRVHAHTRTLDPRSLQTRSCHTRRKRSEGDLCSLSLTLAHTASTAREPAIAASETVRHTDSRRQPPASPETDTRHQTLLPAAACGRRDDKTSVATSKQRCSPVSISSLFEQRKRDSNFSASTSCHNTHPHTLRHQKKASRTANALRIRTLT